MRWLLVLVMVGCISPVMHFGGGKSRTRAQHDTLTELTPARLSMDKRWNGPVVDAKIRVYADDEFRAQNRKWRQAFEERLDYANAVLGAGFGVRLVADYREWNHHAPGATLSEKLDHLQHLDAGDDVLVVVGLTSSLGLVAATFDQLGIATVPGRHMVLRGYSDIEERNSFATAFADLSADERENALVTMRFHKTTAAFLHELGHNLGAAHESADDTLMSERYSLRAVAFSPEAQATIQRTLAQRLGRASPEFSPRTAPVARATARQTMRVVVVADGAIIDGVPREDSELNIIFSVQAAINSEAEVVITKGDAVTTAAITDVVARAKAQGLKNLRFE